MESTAQQENVSAELLQQILAAEKKQLRYARFRFILSIVGILLALAAVITLLIGMRYIKTQVEQVQKTLAATAENINDVVDDLNLIDFKALEETYATFGEAGTKTLQTLEDGIGNLKDVMDNAETALDKLNSVDIDLLNAGIEKLNRVLAPLAQFFGGTGN